MVAQSLMHSIKNHFVAGLGEFAGTFLFLFFAFGGTQTANQPSDTTVSSGPNTSQLMYISIVFGFSLAINVWIFFRVSGGLFNPAVTLALAVCGVVPVVRSIVIFIAQLVAGIAAAAVVRGLIPGNNVLFSVELRSGVSVAQGLFIEMFLTAELVFTILMLAAEKTKATFVAPVGIGLALFVAELFGVYWTGGALNPTRAFGPAVVQGSFPGYHWIYWLGPVLGALLASAFYGLLKFLNYEEVNGDQDKGEDDEKLDAIAKRNSTNKNEKTHHKILRYKNKASKDNNEENRYNDHDDYNRNRHNNDYSDDKGVSHQQRGANTGSHKPMKNNTPLRKQRWSPEPEQEEEDQPYDENYRQSNRQSIQAYNQTYNNQRHSDGHDNTHYPPSTAQNEHNNSKSDSNRKQRTSSENPYSQREQRSKAFAPEPQAIRHLSDDAGHDGPIDPSTGRPYRQDTDAQIRGTRRQSVTRQEREMGYRTDNVAEVGGPAHSDIHRHGSSKRDRRN